MSDFSWMPTVNHGTNIRAKGSRILGKFTRERPTPDKAGSTVCVYVHLCLCVYVCVIYKGERESDQPHPLVNASYAHNSHGCARLKFATRNFICIFHTLAQLLEPSPVAAILGVNLLMEDLSFFSLSLCLSLSPPSLPLSPFLTQK